MAKPTLTVTSEFGTFTRSTARTYTHIVIVKGYKAELVEGYRLESIKTHLKDLANYRKTVETGQCQDARPGAGGEWDRKITAVNLADGSYTRWIAANEAEVARLQAVGPITEDQNTGSLAANYLGQAPTFSVIGWCGRLDLARKLATSTEASRYRTVVIVDVATGKAVR